MSLLLCDDHLLLLEVLAAALTARGEEVVATVTDPDGAADAAARLRPDVCLLDVYFPDRDGISVLRDITVRAPDTKVIMLSATRDPAVVRDALGAGAVGFVPKDKSIESILAALEQVRHDDVAIDPALLHAALGGPTSAAPDDHGPVRPDSWLTPRERDVLEMLVQGMSTAAIGARLGVAPNTTRTHIQNVLIKLGVHSRLQAVAYATRHGIGGGATSPAPDDGLTPTQ